jgi:seryl-tRNA synthetase
MLVQPTSLDGLLHCPTIEAAQIVECIMTSQLVRCTLVSLRQAPARTGLRRAAQQWWGSSILARPFSSSRAAAASAAAVVDAPDASTSQQGAPAEGPAYRAFVDFKFVRDNVEAVAANCRNRLSTADPQLVARLYEEYVRAQQETDKLRAARNENSSAMKVGGLRAAAAAAAAASGAACCPPPVVPPPPLLTCWDARTLPHLQGKLDQEQRVALIERGKGIKDELEGLEARLEQLELELQREGQRLPNMTHPGQLLRYAVLCCAVGCTFVLP